MSRTIYNEGRVVGLSAYEIYLKQHSAVDPNTEPATEREWLASSLAMGSSLLLHIDGAAMKRFVTKFPASIDFTLPTNTKLCAANTIVASYFDGKGIDDMNAGNSWSTWATGIKSYGKLFANNSKTYPSNAATASEISDKYKTENLEIPANIANSIKSYMHIVDGLVLQPGTWIESPCAESDAPKKVLEPDLSKPPVLRLLFDGEITDNIYLLLTGFTMRSVVIGETGLEIPEDSENEAYTYNPQDGDFLGPQAYPWANKVIFSVPNYLHYITDDFENRITKLEDNTLYTYTRTYLQRNETEILMGLGHSDHKSLSVVDLDSANLDTSYNAFELDKISIPIKDYIADGCKDKGDFAVLAVINDNAGFPALYANKVTKTGVKTSKLYPVDVATPFTTKTAPASTLLKRDSGVFTTLLHITSVLEALNVRDDYADSNNSDGIKLSYFDGDMSVSQEFPISSDDSGDCYLSDTLKAVYSNSKRDIPIPIAKLYLPECYEPMYKSTYGFDDAKQNFDINCINRTLTENTNRGILPKHIGQIQAGSKIGTYLSMSDRNGNMYNINGTDGELNKEFASESSGADGKATKYYTKIGWSDFTDMLVNGKSMNLNFTVTPYDPNSFEVMDITEIFAKNKHHALPITIGYTNNDGEKKNKVRYLEPISIETHSYSNEEPISGKYRVIMKFYKSDFSTVSRCEIHIRIFLNYGEEISCKDGEYITCNMIWRGRTGLFETDTISDNGNNSELVSYLWKDIDLQIYQDLHNGFDLNGKQLDINSGVGGWGQSAFLKGAKYAGTNADRLVIRDRSYNYEKDDKSELSMGWGYKTTHMILPECHCIEHYGFNYMREDFENGTTEGEFYKSSTGFSLYGTYIQ